MREKDYRYKKKNKGIQIDSTISQFAFSQSYLQSKWPRGLSALPCQHRCNVDELPMYCMYVQKTIMTNMYLMLVTSNEKDYTAIHNGTATQLTHTNSQHLQPRVFLFSFSLVYKNAT